MTKVKEKHYSKISLDNVTDKALLEANKLKRQEQEKKKNDKQQFKKEIKEEKPLKWYDKNINISDFIVKEYNNEWYGQVKYWKNNIWIGPYQSNDEINKIIKEYVNELKKPVLNRKFKNIHSILLKL